MIVRRTISGAGFDRDDSARSGGGGAAQEARMGMPAELVDGFSKVPGPTSSSTAGSTRSSAESTIKIRRRRPARPSGLLSSSIGSRLSCRISEDQKKKLQIAGRGDIKRFLDEMREMKRRYRQIKADPQSSSPRCSSSSREIQTSSAADLFGESSLLSKMLTRRSRRATAAYAKASGRIEGLFASGRGRAGRPDLRSGDRFQRRPAAAS